VCVSIAQSNQPLWRHGSTVIKVSIGPSPYTSSPIPISTKWRAKNSDLPLLSVMSAIDAAIAPIAKHSSKMDKSLKDTTQRIAIAAVKGAATQVAKRIIGEAADEIAAELGFLDRRAYRHSAGSPASGRYF
jgi:hypothetical protein